MSSHMAGLVTQTTANIDYILLGAFAATSAAGILTGALYRAGAAIIASFATIIAVGVIGVGESWSFWRIALVAVGLITALQVGYLLGVALALSSERIRSGFARGWRRVAVLDDETRSESVGEPPEG
jgi:hypothetical protein